MDGKTLRRLGCAAGLLMSASLAQPAMAREFGFIGTGGLQDLPGGGTNGSTADVIPPGVFMVDQFFIRNDFSDKGAGAAFNTDINGNHPQGHVNVDVAVFLFNPGWTFLGANTQFIIAQPFVGAVSGTANIEGMVDTLFLAEAAWKFGDWHVKLGFGSWVPDGNQNAANGSAPALPYFTLQPEFVLSYESGPWAATAFTYWEIDTKNSYTNYQNAPIFHADFTLAYTLGKWTFGPVADFYTQVGSDKTSAFYANSNAAVSGVTCAGPASFECIGPNNFWAWAVGALIQYNFGPVTLQMWATDVVATHVSGSTPSTAGACGLGAGNPGTVSCNDVTNSGYVVWFQASYALWTPEPAPAPVKAPLIYK